MANSSAATSPGSSLSRWFEWVLAIVLLVLAFGHFVVRPAAERIAQGLGGLATMIAAGAAQALAQSHELACQAIEQDVYARELLGSELVCAPLEHVTWLPTRDGETVEFQFEVVSSTGKRATALLVARMEQDGPQIESVVLTNDEASVLLVPLP